MRRVQESIVQHHPKHILCVHPLYGIIKFINRNLIKLHGEIVNSVEKKIRLSEYLHSVWTGEDKWKGQMIRVPAFAYAYYGRREKKPG